ncbi:class I glutamine amidotransferase-like protein [Apiospora arundinis]|uniref:Class I glutamine amidotransferase-like protein n=1 Tax=Apiospora arundinis TaxID=335852 RepID=A0ABR2IV17_9PEZI
MGSSEPMTTQQRPLRLAILEADTPVPGVLAKYGKYGSVFAHLFRQACAPDSLESQLTLSAHDVVNDPSSYPDPETLDAVLITGSKHSAFEDHEWILRLVAYTKRLLEQPAARPDGRPPVRVIGVCFGHQIVGRAMGAPVGRSDRGWELSVVDMALTDEGKRIFGGETLKIHHMHRDIVHEYPKGTIPLAHTDVCATQAMYIPQRMIALQGHPEFTEDIMREILEVRHKGGILPDDVFENAMSRAPDAHDGVAIARAFLKFLRE